MDQNSVRTSTISPGAPPATNQLLHDIWRSPAGVYYIGALDRNTAHFNNIAVTGADDAVRRALTLSSAGYDTFFACSEFAAPISRKASNASGAYGFWADLDCGEEKYSAGKGYQTADDALKATIKFCNLVEIPEPTHDVSSGGGLHTYWIVDALVTREIWQTYARKLKRLTKTHGLLADDTRTADIASVLRVPGTLNFKYDPPRRVVMLRSTDKLIARDAMLAAIDLACEAAGFETVTTRTRPTRTARP
jgi:hypothetical protein